jgi:mono/diheme cytochrome c family protein
MNKHQRIYLVIAIIYMILASCTKNQAEEMTPAPPVVPETPGTTSVTYNNFVEALMQTKCAGCHAPGGRGSGAFIFNGFTSVTGNAERIRQAVLVTKTMPPGGSLSPAELQSLTKWFDDGMPEK